GTTVTGSGVVLRIASESVLPPGPLSFGAFTNTTLQASAPLTISRPIVTAATIDTNGFDVTIAGPIQGGQVTKIGGGTLTLAATNTYPNGTQVKAGILSVAADS